MGGGNFLDKGEEVYAARDNSGATFKKVWEGVKKGILENRKNGKIIYTLDLSAYGAVIFGITEAKMEGKAFGIAGEKRSSDSYEFPGIDHDAVFPIEVIVYKEGGKAKVFILNERYRMKVYFEGAGNWAFMKNMRMPGQIQDEIVDMVNANLK